MNRNSTLKILLSMIIPLLIGCTTFVVDVSSYNTGVNDKKKIFILSGNKNVSNTDVEFIEYSTYVAKALAKNGFVVVNNLDEADQVLLLGYAISGPQSYAVDIPIWGPTGLSSSTTYGNINSSGNFSSNTYYNYTYGLKGFNTVQRVYFTRVIVLVAYDWQLFKKSKTEKQIWQTQIISSGSSDDLRYIFPYMIAAAEKYIGRTTRGKVTVEISEYDRRVREYMQSD